MPEASLATETFTDSNALYDLGRQYLPGGVTGPGRKADATIGHPFYVQRGQGSRVWDVEGREYIDFQTSFGAALLGHGHPRVVAALQDALAMGNLCALETEEHVQAARKLCEAVPAFDMVRFSGSGTETTWHVVKLARAFTGKEKIVKLEGHFHGFNEYLQYNMTPPLDHALPNVHVESPGFPKSAEELVYVLPYNDLDAVEQLLAQHHDEIAAIILEPVNYNPGCILPLPGYLEGLRSLTRDYGVLLIFDEILSSFRTGPDCIQGYYGVTPDLSTVGKALGGGTAMSAFGGRREIMEQIMPLGPVVHTGTFVGHLSPIVATSTFLDIITEPDFYPTLLGNCDYLYAGLEDCLERHGVTGRVQALGARFTILFGIEEEPVSYPDVARRDVQFAHDFFIAAYERGLWMPAMAHIGISSAHTRADIDQSLTIVDDVLREMSGRPVRMAV
jgi:glutamate-1-semialdehyde 2,1-aminomutase